MVSRIDTKGLSKDFYDIKSRMFPLDGQESEEQTIWLWKHREMRSGDNSLGLRLESRIKVWKNFIRNVYLVGERRLNAVLKEISCRFAKTDVTVKQRTYSLRSHVNTALL